MITISRLAVVSLLAVLGCAKPVTTDKVVHDYRTAAPNDFVHSGAAPGDTMLNLRINLAQRDRSGLETALNDASNPSSSSYGKWLAKEDVEKFVKPHDVTTVRVNQWLYSHGVKSTSVTPAGDWLSINIPVSKANHMLDADFSVFTHSASGKTSVRTLSYSMPSLLLGHIRAIHPTTSFMRPKNRHPVTALAKRSDLLQTPRASDSDCNSKITPACLQSLYKLPTTPAKNTDNGIGVVGFSPQYANKADLKTFLKTYRKDMDSSTTFKLNSVDGGTNLQNNSEAGLEANLDIQYTVGIATNVPVTFIQIGGSNQDGEDGGYLDIINALLAEPSPPSVVTTSYGFDTEGTLSRSLSDSLCDSYMQLTARGVSILFATGDGGVAATPGESCGARFNPPFPTCPYVTLVGATGGVPEIGADLSAGGFSNYFPQADWQSSAVEGYLKTLGNEYKGKYNASGRAFPDISAQGVSVEIIQSGGGTTVDGTSCSSPIVASVIGLLNDELLSAGKPVLGFLNPWLYANPGAFNDITSGSNPGCGTKGFPAIAGWDPVTGLGTPNYAKMRTAAGL